MTMIRILRNLAETLASGAFWRAKYGAWLARRFDARYGTDTMRQVPVALMLDVPTALAQHAVHYEASSIPKLRQALEVVSRRVGGAIDRYTFVDVGSGKGLAAMLAARAGFRAVHGVEMAPDLHAIAESNLQKFVARHPGAASIRLHCMDALQFEWPEGPLVLYLYNPFDAVLMAQLAARLPPSTDGGETLIAYVNPIHRGVFDRHSACELLYDDGRVCVFAYRPTRMPIRAGAPSMEGSAAS